MLRWPLPLRGVQQWWSTSEHAAAAPFFRSATVQAGEHQQGFGILLWLCHTPAMEGCTPAHVHGTQLCMFKTCAARLL